MFEFINCYHRKDNQTVLPTKGACSTLNPNWRGSHPMPATGAFTALPAGSYLTGYDLSAYTSNKEALYYYCGAQVAAGSIGSAFNLGTVGTTAYPLSFNVFSFGNITGLRDVQGPVAGGGTVSASSFNINWGQTQPVGVVSTGLLTLLNGTVSGAIYHGAGESSFTGVNYAQSTNYSGTPIDFGNARTQLQTMSQTLFGLVANGTTTVAYGNITLTGTDPNLNIFSVGMGALNATTSITINAPQSSTVIINVSGTTPRIVNAGITNYALVNRVLWNFYQATSLYVTSVGIPGSVLAPFAQASLGGNINGTVIAETVESTNEFHQTPFLHNWLVP
jgi:choice-of-anchor A domain-containing protein